MPKKHTPPSTKYTVHPIPTALKGLRLYMLKERDPRLPSFYIYDGRHPLCQETSNRPIGRTFVYFVDCSADGKALARSLSDEVEVPYGRLATMQKKAPGTNFAPTEVIIH